MTGLGFGHTQIGGVIGQQPHRGKFGDTDGKGPQRKREDRQRRLTVL